jgi:hypothetical protein
MFSYESFDRREHFRVYPSISAPIFLIFNGEQAQVINIGAGGLAFKNKSFKKGDSLSVEFKLPIENVSLSALLEVKVVDDKNICRCQFKEIGAEASEAIHQYVLIRQKEIIRSKKKRPKSNLNDFNSENPNSS